MGRTPACAHAWVKRTAPDKALVSVIATASMPSSAARAGSSSGRTAPSRSENVVRTERCTKSDIASTPDPEERPAAVAEIARELVGARRQPVGFRLRIDAPDLARVPSRPRLCDVARGFPPSTCLSPAAQHLTNDVALPAPRERFDAALRRLDDHVFGVPFRHDPTTSHLLCR